MWEALTDWSEDDPKWLVLFIIIGGWVFWSQLRFTLKYGYNSWLEKPYGFLNWGRAIGGLLMFLYGVIELFRRLFVALF